MVFAPEDKRAWQDSEIMAEFEKVAKEVSLLNGGPPEAFQPIPEAIIEQASWEDEDIFINDLKPQRSELENYSTQLINTIEKMAQELAEIGHIKAAYRIERTLAALKDISNVGGE